jgi:hypothetical protein
MGRLNSRSAQLAAARAAKEEKAQKDHEEDDEEEDEEDDEDWVTDALAEGAFDAVMSVNEALCWTADAETAKIGRAHYTGDSIRTQQRRAKTRLELAMCAQGSAKITFFFKMARPGAGAASAPAVVDMEDEADIDPGQLQVGDSDPTAVTVTAPSPAADREIVRIVTVKPALTEAQALRKLEGLLKFTGNKRAATANMGLYDLLRLTAVRACLLGRQAGLQLMDASSKAVAEVFALKAGSRGTVYKATCVRNWTSAFLASGQLPPLKQGQHPKCASLIEEEDVRQRCRIWLREQSPGKITSRSFASFVSSEFAEQLPGGISERHARRWLHAIGFDYDALKKGMLAHHACGNPVLEISR